MPSPSPRPGQQYCSAGVLLGRLVWQLVASERRWRASTIAGPAWLQERARALAPAAPDVRLSLHGDGPLAVGLWHRIIVLPADSIGRLSPAALDAVMAHETAHHARRDLAWLALASAFTAVAWFNPLAHLAARALRATREDGSDDWAVQRTSRDPITYAQTLLQSARMLTAPPAAIVAGAHPLRGRLYRLLDADARREGPEGWFGLAAIVLTAAIGIPSASVPDTTPDERRDVVVIRRVTKG